jgi:hypothetical protein
MKAWPGMPGRNAVPPSYRRAEHTPAEEAEHEHEQEAEAVRINTFAAWADREHERAQRRGPS